MDDLKVTSTYNTKMELISKDTREPASTIWQQRVRCDVEWLNSKIWNASNYIKMLEREERNHTREIRTGLEYGAIGSLAGAGLAALACLIKKEQVRFWRFASYAGVTGVAVGFVGLWLVDWERDNSSSEANDLQHLNNIKRLLADTYGSRIEANVSHAIVTDDPSRRSRAL